MNPFETPLNVTKKDKAQFHMLRCKQSSIDDVKLTLKHTFSLKFQSVDILVSGIIKPSGELLLVNFTKRQLLSCKPNGSDLKIIIKSIQNSPVDVCRDEKTNSALVGFACSKEAVIVNLETGKTTGLGKYAFAVDYNQGYYFGTDPDRRLIWRRESKTFSNSHRIELNSRLYYCNGFEKHFICSHFSDNSVSAYDYGGKQLWEFSHENFKEPLGVTSTSDRSIFVACRKSNNIWLISSEGKDGRVILSAEDGMVKPRGINFNTERKELLVVCENSSVFVHTVDW